MNSRDKRKIGLSVTFTLLLAVLALMVSLPYSSFASPPTDEPDQTSESGQARRQAVRQAQLADQQPIQELAPMSATACVNGMAGQFPCKNVDLLALMPFSELGGGLDGAADIWGWTDSQSGKEYAIMNRKNGTVFVDISDPENPVYLGNLPSHTGVASIWRDVKVYKDHAFIVADGNDGHGVQVFDLTQLRDVTTPPVTFSNTAHYDGGVSSVHNIAINEDSGYAYVVGAATCEGGLDMINIQDPLNPTGEGCFDEDGYTHDAQCVMYNGPDTAHQGQEICFNANEDTLTIADVSNKSNPIQLSREGYQGASYSHQGWLTEDHAYFLMDDELDEQNLGHNTHTYIWDVRDLDAPVFINTYVGPSASIDHNLYIKGDYAYAANYRSGLRILNIEDIANGNLVEEAFFDTYPDSDSAEFNGAWSNYPFFESGVVIVSGIEHGLFILKPNDSFSVEATPSSVDVCLGQDGTVDLNVGKILNFTDAITLSASGLPDGTNSAFSQNSMVPPFNSVLTIGNTGMATAGSYDLEIAGASTDDSQSTMVALNLYPTSLDQMATLNAPADGASEVFFAPMLSWSAVDHAANYLVEVATDADFSNIVYSATETGTSHTISLDNALDFGTQYYWRVTAQNSCDQSTSATSSFTTVEGFCSMPDADIPGRDEDGVSDSITIASSGNINDIDLLLDASHALVGNLVFTLEHNGTSVTLIDRPGYTDSGNGCRGDNIHASLDDEASESVEEACADESPTISGLFAPNNPLSAFDGQDLSGSWTLTAVDNAPPSSSGTLNKWCVISQYERPAAVYSVDSSADMAMSGITGEMVTYTIGITNTGNMSDMFDLTATGTWTPTLSSESVSLDAGANTMVHVSLMIPADAEDGTSDMATFTATSQGDMSVSAMTHLTTTAVMADKDSDGVSNETENAAPNSGDGNEDGMADSAQNHVTSMPNATNEHNYVTLESPAGSTLVNVHAMAAPAEMPDTVSAMPEGAFDFTINGLNNGDTITVTLMFHSGNNAIDGYWKHDHNTNQWSDFSDHATFQTKMVGDQQVTTVILTLTDGGNGDADGMENGIIVDPGAPVTRAPTNVSLAGLSTQSATSWLPIMLTLLLLTVMAATGLFVARQKAFKQ